MAAPAMTASTKTMPALDRWQPRRRRAGQLCARHPFAGEVLTLYQRLLDVQEPAYRAALAARPSALAGSALADYIAEAVAPAIVALTAAHAPAPLANAARTLRGGGKDAIARWLAGEIMAPADNWFARAAAAPVLEAMTDSSPGRSEAAGDPGHCPRCGGLPQLAFTDNTDDALLTAPRRLLCARCSATWPHARIGCAACGETAADRLHVYADAARFPHLRIDACHGCRSYLIGVDLRKDPEAVPEVDELAALPLDLHVQALGFGKIVPNLMGIG
jgi:formate dehydrogenase maturation protein FdhE